MLRTAPLALLAGLLLFTASPSDAPTAPERLAAAPEAPAALATYGIDGAHSNVGFRIRHMGVAFVEGEFDDYDGSITFDPADLSATAVQATVQMASVDTDVEARDNHLRSADFFEVEAHPTMTFTSTSVEPTGVMSFRLTGDLTIKGVTRAVTFDVDAAGPVADPRGGARVGFHGTTSINRRDFNITYGGNLPGGYPMVADQVQIVLDVEGRVSA
jgi:polyisoprenoid-binding protein YceI